ncbi:MAG: GNAT family N-acetyltransferase [Acidobacteria bacterium]|nr:GNAT family N-acetyltransferase [Acidobacteriota bacterium]
MTSHIALRAARPEESTILTELARASKAIWDYPPAWLEAWRDDLSFSREYIGANHVIVAEVGNGLAGVIAVGDGADGPEIGHLWVGPEHQGLGVGKALLAAGVAAARGNNWDELRIESDPNARQFYEHLGAVHCGDVPAPVCGIDRTLPLLRLRIPASGA